MDGVPTTADDAAQLNLWLTRDSECQQAFEALAMLIAVRTASICGAQSDASSRSPVTTWRPCRWCKMQPHSGIPTRTFILLPSLRHAKEVQPRARPPSWWRAVAPRLRHEGDLGTQQQQSVSSATSSASSSCKPSPTLG